MENKMKKNYAVKLVTLAFCLALAVAGIVGITVAAEATDVNAAVKTVTLNYGAELRLAYVYEISGAASEDVELRVSDKADLSDYTATDYTGDLYNGYPMYYSTGISAKDIADTIYVAPYYKGEQIGDVVAYSVLNYCYDVLYGESTKNVDDLVALANELIEYGTAAQQRLINIGNIPAETLIPDYVYVYTSDKSISINGRRSAIVAPGAEVTVFSENAGGYIVTYANGETETLNGKSVSFIPSAIACIEMVEPAPIVDFEGIDADSAWAEDMTAYANIKLLETSTATATVKEENGNKYLEYNKNSTAKRGGLRITKTLETAADEAVMFQANVRFNSLSVSDNRAYFRFYNSALKEISLGSSYYFTVNAEGNVTLGGVDTGVAADEWFALTFKFTTNKLEVLINGKLLSTFNATDIQNTVEVRLYSDSTMLHQTDLDDIYYGAYDANIVATEPPVEPIGFEGIAADTAWESGMADEVTITNLKPASTNITVRGENGNNYLEYDKHSTSDRGALRFFKNAQTEENQAIVFEMKVRHTDVAEAGTSAYFRFFDSATKALGDQILYISKDAESGNIAFDNVDTGIAVGEWFVLTIKVTTDTIEVLIDGNTFGTYTATGIQNIYEVRLCNDAAMLYGADLDDVYFGASN